jgi:hypothetical protein
MTLRLFCKVADVDDNTVVDDANVVGAVNSLTPGVNSRMSNNGEAVVMTLAPDLYISGNSKDAAGLCLRYEFVSDFVARGNGNW